MSEIKIEKLLDTSKVYSLWKKSKQKGTWLERFEQNLSVFKKKLKKLKRMRNENVQRCFLVYHFGVLNIFAQCNVLESSYALASKRTFFTHWDVKWSRHNWSDAGSSGWQIHASHKGQWLSGICCCVFTIGTSHSSRLCSSSHLISTTWLQPWHSINLIVNDKQCN